MQYRQLEDIEGEYWNLKRTNPTTAQEAVAVLEILARHRIPVHYCYGNKGNYSVRSESIRRKHIIHLATWIALNDLSMPLVIFDQRGRGLDYDDAQMIESLRQAYPRSLPGYAHIFSARCIGLQFAHYVVAAIRSHYAGVTSEGYERIAGLVRLGVRID